MKPVKSAEVHANLSDALLVEPTSLLGAVIHQVSRFLPLHCKELLRSTFTLPVTGSPELYIVLFWSNKISNVWSFPILASITWTMTTCAAQLRIFDASTPVRCDVTDPARQWRWFKTFSLKKNSGVVKLRTSGKRNEDKGEFKVKITDRNTALEKWLWNALENMAQYNKVQGRVWPTFTTIYF